MKIFHEVLFVVSAGIFYATNEFIRKKISLSPLFKAPTVGVLSLQGRGWPKECPSLEGRG